MLPEITRNIIGLHILCGAQDNRMNNNQINLVPIYTQPNSTAKLHIQKFPYVRKLSTHRRRGVNEQW